MDITQDFLSACTGKTFVDGRLENPDGNWWVARINGTFALVGWEACPFTQAAADVLTNAAATLNGGGVDLGGNTYTFGINNDNALDRL
jgi:hypothetical protein